MKLEVGMYAYSKHSRDYGIGKIVNIHTNGFANQEVEIQYKDVKLSTSYDDVIASHELIDLIDLGDYVNGQRIEETISSGNYKAICINLFYRNQRRKLCLENKDIESVVTKEQFKFKAYEVE